jgi:hypothetical protein
MIHATLRITWPWWKDLWIMGCVCLALAGLPMDPERCARVLTRRAKCEIVEL